MHRWNTTQGQAILELMRVDFRAWEKTGTPTVLAYRVRELAERLGMKPPAVRRGLLDLLDQGQVARAHCTGPLIPRAHYLWVLTVKADCGVDSETLTRAIVQGS